MQSSVLVLLLSCAVLASASVLVSSGQSEEPANRQIPNVLRFLVTPKTITSTVTVSSTTVVTKGITTSCAVSVVGIPNCRRRRNVMEEPIFLEAEEEDEDEINPSAPVELMVTALPEMRSLDVQAEAAAEVQPSIENTAGMAEVQIRDMESICKARVANPFFGVGLAQVFGITVLYSTTVTVTQPVTSTSTTVATTNTITINGCFPSPLPFNNC
ncbi:uncharacterized protein LOC124197273 [Daphnia pulex]|uniref:uncharacterized protein LOC124197273 n=1 Tax=Daphnia pulex TaxID=6669 RepID=UPI001EDD7493|nr:uncharacterized protein LOC124197273 [Daphnia pulex]